MIGDDGFYLDFGFNADETSHQKVVYMIEDVRKRMSTITDKEFGFNFDPDMAKFTLALKKAFQFAWNETVVTFQENIASSQLLGLPLNVTESLRNLGKGMGVDLIADAKTMTQELALIKNMGQLNDSRFIALSQLSVNGSAFLAEQDPTKRLAMVIDAAYKKMSDASNDPNKYAQAVAQVSYGLGPEFTKLLNTVIAGTTAETRPKTIAQTMLTDFAPEPSAAYDKAAAKAYAAGWSSFQLKNALRKDLETPIADVTSSLVNDYSAGAQWMLERGRPTTSLEAELSLMNLRSSAYMTEPPVGGAAGVGANAAIGLLASGMYMPGKKDELQKAYQEYSLENQSTFTPFETDVWNYVNQVIAQTEVQSADDMRSLMGEIFKHVFDNLKKDKANKGLSEEVLSNMALDIIKGFSLPGAPGTLNFPAMYNSKFFSDKDMFGRSSRDVIEKDLKKGLAPFYSVPVEEQQKEQIRAVDSSGGTYSPNVFRLEKNKDVSLLEAISGRALAYAGSSSEAGRSSLDVDIRINGERAVPTIITGAGKTAVSSALNINNIMQG